MSSLTIRSKINVAVQKIQKCTMIKMINSLIKTIMPFYFSNYSNITLVVIDNDFIICFMVPEIR